MKFLIENLKDSKESKENIAKSKTQTIIDNFKHNITNLLRFKNSFDYKIFSKLAKEYKESVNKFINSSLISFLKFY